MDFRFDFTCIEELTKKVEELATEQEKERVNKKILKSCGDLAYKTVVPLIHRAKDHSKSGPQHKGTQRSTPNGNAADNVPSPKMRRKNGELYVIVGWDNSDTSEFFYMKFEEWGTTKRQPHHSFGKVNKMLYKEYDRIAEEEYTNLLEKIE